MEGCRAYVHMCAGVLCSLQRKHTHVQKPHHHHYTTTITTTLLSPRATRAKSTKRHVENEGEERGGGKERVIERRDEAQKTTRSTNTCSNTDCRWRDAIGVIPAVGDVCVNRNEMGDVTTD